MSLVKKVVAATGATVADVMRVATEGGTTRADWDIAHAIQAATGRSAYELMLLAGRDAEIAAIWADSRAEAEPPAPTNPDAKHDANVRIYPEHTSPEESRELIEHHPHTEDTDEPLADEPADEPGTAAWEELKATAVWAEAARITGQQYPGLVTRTIAPWKSARQAIKGLTGLLKACRPKRSRFSLAA